MKTLLPYLVTLLPYLVTVMSMFNHHYGIIDLSITVIIVPVTCWSMSYDDCHMSFEGSWVQGDKGSE